MATLETEIRIANLLLSLGQAEQSLEQAREKLAQHRMFDPLLLFRLLDTQDSGMATFANLKRFMADFGVDYTDEQIGLLKHDKGAESQVSSAMASAKKPETLVSPNKYIAYDRGRLEASEGLGFDRFLNLIVPVNHLATFEFNIGMLKYADSKVEPNMQLKVLLMRVIDKEISLTSNLQEQKTELVFQSQMTGTDTFRLVDTRNQGSIEPENLFRFLKKHDRRLEENQLLPIFRRIKSKIQGLITPSEWSHFLGLPDSGSPKSASPVYRSEKKLDQSQNRVPIERTHPRMDGMRSDKRLTTLGTSKTSTISPRLSSRGAEEQLAIQVVAKHSKLGALELGPFQRRASKGDSLSFRAHATPLTYRDTHQTSRSRSRHLNGSTLNPVAPRPLSKSGKGSRDMSRNQSRRNSKDRDRPESGLRGVPSRSRPGGVRIDRQEGSREVSREKAELSYRRPNLGSKTATQLEVPTTDRKKLIQAAVKRSTSGIIPVSSEKVLSRSHSRSSSRTLELKREDSSLHNGPPILSNQRNVSMRGYTPSTYRLDDSQAVLHEPVQAQGREGSTEQKSLLSQRRNEHKQASVQQTPQSQLTEDLLEFPVGRLGKESSTQRTSVVDDVPVVERRTPSGAYLHQISNNYTRTGRSRLEPALEAAVSPVSRSMNESRYNMPTEAWNLMKGHGPRVPDRTGGEDVGKFHVVQPRQPVAISTIDVPSQTLTSEKQVQSKPDIPQSREAYNRDANPRIPRTESGLIDSEKTNQKNQEQKIELPPVRNTRQIQNLNERLQQEQHQGQSDSHLSNDDQDQYTLRRRWSPDASFQQDDFRYDVQRTNTRQTDLKAQSGYQEPGGLEYGEKSDMKHTGLEIPFSSSAFDEVPRPHAGGSSVANGVDKIGLRVHGSNEGDDEHESEKFDATSLVLSGPVDSLHGHSQQAPWEAPIKELAKPEEQKRNLPRVENPSRVENWRKYRDPHVFTSMQEAATHHEQAPPSREQISVSKLPTHGSGEQTQNSTSFQKGSSKESLSPFYAAKQGQNGLPIERDGARSLERRSDTKPLLQPAFQREYTFSDSKFSNPEEIDQPNNQSARTHNFADLQSNRMMTSTYNEASDQDLQAFVQVLKKILQYAEKIEELKTIVYRTPNFSLLDQFYAFDFEGKGYLSFNEFSQLFNSFKINLSREDLMIYLQRMLKNSTLTSDICLHPEELAVCFSPIDTHGRPLKLRPIRSLNEQLTVFSSLLTEVPYIVSKQLQQIIQLQRKIHDEITTALKTINFFARKSVFNLIVHGITTTPEKSPPDRDSSTSIPGITWEDLKTLLQNHGVEFYEEDLNFVYLEFKVAKPRFISLTEYLNFFRVYGPKSSPSILA